MILNYCKPADPAVSESEMREARELHADWHAPMQMRGERARTLAMLRECKTPRDMAVSVAYLYRWKAERMLAR